MIPEIFRLERSESAYERSHNADRRFVTKITAATAIIYSCARDLSSLS